MCKIGAAAMPLGYSTRHGQLKLVDHFGAEKWCSLVSSKNSL